MSSLFHRRIFSVLAALAVAATVLASLLSGQLAQALPAATPDFTAATPLRVMDTRQGLNGWRLGEGGTRHLRLPALVPNGVTAVAVNVTVVNATAPTYVTAWAKGSPRPHTSTVNVTPHEVRANAAIVAVGRDRSITLFNGHGSVDVVVDVTGWFRGGFQHVTPTRVVDTRSTGGGGPVGNGMFRTINLPSHVRVPRDADGVVVNITATNATAPSYVSVVKSLGSRPESSTLNVVPGITAANLTVVRPRPNGSFAVYNDAGNTDLIVDVVGWFRRGSLLAADTARVLDTRVDRCRIRLGTGATRTVQVSARTDVGGAVLNVTGVAAAGSTYVTVWPTGTPRPETSNVNLTGNGNVANAVVVSLGTAGQVNLYNGGAPVDVIVDVLGLLPGAAKGGTAAVCDDTATTSSTPATPATAPDPRTMWLLGTPSTHAVGVDRVAVWVCEVPATSTHRDYARTTERLHIDAAAVAAWANAKVSPYFWQVSGSRYRVSFEMGGRLLLEHSMGAGDCRNEAMKRTNAPFTNVLATDTYAGSMGMGFAGPGGMYADPAHNPNLLSLAPAITARGAYASPDTLGGHGNSDPSPFLVVHEVGHTLSWPHSFTGIGGEYDNPLDVMSGASWWHYPRPQNTLAFNRLAAGWMTEAEVRLHDEGTTQVRLAAPLSGGTQVVVVPAAVDRRRVLTVESRPATGFDAGQPAEGVAVHVIDQTPGVCRMGASGTGCYGIMRRQAQAWGSPHSTDHVLNVGERRVVDGITIEVIGRVEGSFDVVITGTYRPSTGQLAQMPTTGTSTATSVAGANLVMVCGLPVSPVAQGYGDTGVVRRVQIPMR